MFTVIADAINEYAHENIRSLLEDGDAISNLNIIVTGGMLGCNLGKI